MNSIFISYRREDSADAVGRINDQVRNQFGVEATFLDVDTIPLGVDFRDHLNQKLNTCKVFLAIIGRQWLSIADDKGTARLQQPDDFVRIELETALSRGIPVIPVLVHGVPMPSEDQLPDSLKPLAFRHGISVRADPDFHADAERLIKGLRTYLPARPGNGKEFDVESDEREALPHVLPLNRTAFQLTAALMFAELVPLFLFFFSDYDTPRTISVLFPNIVGAALAVVGTKRHKVLEIVTGTCAVAIPWLLILFLKPLETIVVTSIVIWSLAAMTIKNQRRFLRDL